tara:strand:- start:1666 stop:2139 length:474 start_codon:yes stop_codon:yes gene_type:complete
MSTIIIHEECVKCGCPDNPYHKKNGCELKEYDGVMLQRYVNGREVLCYPNAGYFGNKSIEKTNDKCSNCDIILSDDDMESETGKCECCLEDEKEDEECFNGHAGDCDAEYTFTLAKSRLLELITKDMMTDDEGKYKELEKYVMKIIGHIHLLKLEDC